MKNENGFYFNRKKCPPHPRLSAYPAYGVQIRFSVRPETCDTDVSIELNDMAILNENITSQNQLRTLRVGMGFSIKCVCFLPCHTTTFIQAHSRVIIY